MHVSDMSKCCIPRWVRVKRTCFALDFLSKGIDHFVAFCFETKVAHGVGGLVDGFKLLTAMRMYFSRRRNS